MSRHRLYTSRPSQRTARLAWDYFMSRFPNAIKSGRTCELGYSPNVDHCGPGWVFRLGSLETDTLHWKGGEEIFSTVLSGNLKNYISLCDCECPEPKSGVALVSMSCPIHNSPGDYQHRAAIAEAGGQQS